MKLIILYLTLIFNLTVAQTPPSTSAQSEEIFASPPPKSSKRAAPKKQKIPKPEAPAAMRSVSNIVPNSSIVAPVAPDSNTVAPDSNTIPSTPKINSVANANEFQAAPVPAPAAQNTDPSASAQKPGEQLEAQKQQSSVAASNIAEGGTVTSDDLITKNSENTELGTDQKSGPNLALVIVPCVAVFLLIGGLSYATKVKRRNDVGFPETTEKNEFWIA